MFRNYNHNSIENVNFLMLISLSNCYIECSVLLRAHCSILNSYGGSSECNYYSCEYIKESSLVSKLRTLLWISIFFKLNILTLAHTHTYTHSHTHSHTHTRTQVDKETLNFVQVNENIRTNKRVRLRETLCNCPQDNSHIRAPVIDNSLRHSDNIPNKAKDVHSLQILAHNDNISSYLNPTKEPDRGSEGSTSYLSHEYQLKKKLLIAVITSEEHLKMADVVYDTWGSSAGQLIFFVGSECNVSLPIATGLPLVRLPNVHDTPVNSVEKVFDALKYISDNYMETFHWLMLATDNLFVRVSKLETLLMKLDPSSYVYLGRSANGRHGDMDKLSLLSHEHYCLGSTGVVLSAGLVKALTPHLQVCVSAAVNQAGSGGGRAVEWAWPDVELGRCVSRMTGTQCSQSQEVRVQYNNSFCCMYTACPFHSGHCEI